MAGLAQPTVWGACAPQAGSVDQSVPGGALSVRDCGPLSFPHVRFAAPCSPESHQERCCQKALSPDRDCGRSSRDHASPDRDCGRSCHDHHEELWEASIARCCCARACVLFAKRKWLWKRDDTNQKQKEKLRIMLPNEKNCKRGKNSKRCSYLYKGCRDPLPIGLK